jgi:hypothetical protein
VSLKDKIAEERKHHQDARQLAGKLDAKVEDLVKRLRENRDHRDRLRKKINDDSLTDQQREELADRLEALEKTADFLVERIDHLDDRSDAAKKARRDHADRIERLRRKRKRIREDKDGQLTKHFHRAEFDCRDGTPVPDAAILALRDACERYLEPLRAKHGVVHINSGYRTRSYNASVGGASNSVHIYDEHPGAAAVDHVAAGAGPPTVQNFHDNVTHPDGMGYYSVFTHVDNRNRIGWSDSRWHGS